MKNFLVIQHTYAEFLGPIEKQLESRDIGFSYQRPFTGQDIPGSALQYDSLWLLGGAFPITDKESCPWLDDEIRLIGVFKHAKRPIVGIGFGGLLVAQYEGGVASAEPLHTAYWTTAHKTEVGKDDPLANAVDGVKVLVMYNGKVDLPKGIEPILVDDEGNWLAIRPDELTYGILFRPEIKPGMIEDMIMEANRPLPEHIGTLLGEARMNWNDMQVTMGKVAVALVSALDLMKERRKMPVFSLNVVRTEDENS
ncbi:type 1 glutamine amidotransferase [Sulfurirhabdus autotrophica]|uniref:GMP synthase-like glutamine amidotransferase n=1 Tax=Sulfurirhabdus autotrophica TaxID=1706046 RepID=A0A4R3YGL1_9PROT|nr:GMP synthase [Sulfurirhabdus autotrophica]TCV90084.1 GMP synthase-like glutamine amidotransferase [Sulfurirhabdus autotrophica]